MHTGKGARARARALARWRCGDACGHPAGGRGGTQGRAGSGADSWRARKRRTGPGGPDGPGKRRRAGDLASAGSVGPATARGAGDSRSRQGHAKRRGCGRSTAEGKKQVAAGPQRGRAARAEAAESATSMAHGDGRTRAYDNGMTGGYGVERLERQCRPQARAPGPDGAPWRKRQGRGHTALVPTSALTAHERHMLQQGARRPRTRSLSGSPARTRRAARGRRARRPCDLHCDREGRDATCFARSMRGRDHLR